MYWFPVLTKTFKRGYKRKRPSQQIQIDEVLRLLTSVLHPQGFCRPKYGILDDCYGFDLDDDTRIIMRFDEDFKQIHLLRVCSQYSVQNSH